MANLKIHVGANNVDENYNTNWCVEVIQNNFTVLSAFSTERNTGGADPTFVKGISSFDPNQSTTIKYYNLGKKTNTISIKLINLVDGFEVTSGNGTVTDGQMKSVTFNIPAGAFGGRINVYCNEVSQTLSGVDYVGSGTQSGGLFQRVISTKTGDSNFVGVETANVTANPNYIAPITSGLTAPTVNATARTTTQTLTFGGMQTGDLLKLYLVELIGSQTAPDGKVSEWNIFAEYNGSYSPFIGSYAGFTMKGKYTRGGVDSPFSSNVTITQDAGQLAQMTFTKYLTPGGSSVPGNNYVVNDKVDITNLVSGAALNIYVGLTNTLATEGTHYSKATISGGFRITFLTLGVLNFVQSKSGNTDSASKYITCEALLPKPILSANVRTVGESVTVMNTNNSYDSMLVYKNGDLAQSTDYTLAIGNFTFLTVGIYTFKGQKSGLPDSVESDDVVVSVNTTVSRRRYTITDFSTADVAAENVQIGSGATAASVDNWTDGLVIELDINNGVRPKFFLRDKTDFTKVTRPYVIT